MLDVPCSVSCRPSLQWHLPTMWAQVHRAHQHPRPGALQLLQLSCTEIPPARAAAPASEVRMPDLTRVATPVPPIALNDVRDVSVNIQPGKRCLSEFLFVRRA